MSSYVGDGELKPKIEDTCVDEFSHSDFYRMTIPELDDAYRGMMDELRLNKTYEQMNELQNRLTNVCITVHNILKREKVYPVTTDTIYDDVLEREGL